MSVKTYQVSDIFFTDWKQVPSHIIPVVYALQQQILSKDPGDKEYGFLLIMILSNLRKNPLLVDKINVHQAVDIYNDLSFLNKPWFFFPFIKRCKTPDDYMARHTFDHFIYADNEFSSYVVTQDQKYLRRLVATIYQDNFDKEAVQEIADKRKVNDWQLQMVFYTYANVREFITTRCKNLLPKSPEVEVEGQTKKATPTGALWLKIKHRLSETPAFQGYDNAGRANMYSALDYLEDLAQQKADAKT